MFSFYASKTKHEALVPCTLRIKCLAVYTLIDESRLSSDIDQNITQVWISCVHSDVVRIVANVRSHLASNGIIIWSRCIKRHFSCENNYTLVFHAFYTGFNCHTSIRIKSKTRIDNGIGYSITQLIWMTTCYRLRSEDVFLHVLPLLC